MVTVGNGFFKPNISTMVGELYRARATGAAMPGFTIFYMGINLGSLLSQILCPFLADDGRLVGRVRAGGDRHAVVVALIQFDGGRLDGYGEPPARAAPDRAIGDLSSARWSAVPVFYFLFTNLMNARRAGRRDRASSAIIAVAAADGQVAVRHVPDRRFPAS